MFFIATVGFPLANKHTVSVDRKTIKLNIEIYTNNTRCGRFFLSKQTVEGHLTVITVIKVISR